MKSHKNKCSDCIHSDVCLYLKEYIGVTQKYVGVRIVNGLEERYIPVDAVIYKCVYYKEKK